MTYRAWNLKTLDRAAVRELTHAIAEQNTEELEYHSQSEEPWTEAQYNATLAAQQKETALLAGILAARGITDPTEALTLLAGEEELTDPMLLTDMDKAGRATATACPKTPSSPSTTRAVSSSSRWTTALPPLRKPSLQPPWG